MFGARRGALASAIRRVSEGGELDYVPDSHIDNVVFLVQKPYRQNTILPTVASRVGTMSFKNNNQNCWRNLDAFNSIAPPEGWGDLVIYGGLESQRINNTNFSKHISMEEDWTIEGYFGRNTSSSNTSIRGIIFSADAAGFRWGYTPTSMSFSVKDVSMSGAITTNVSDYNYAALSKTGNTVSMYFNGSLLATLDVTDVTLTDLTTDTLYFLSSGGIPSASNSLSTYLMRVTKGVGRYSGSSHEVPTKPFQDWSDVSGDPLFYRNAYLWQVSSGANGVIRYGGENSHSARDITFNSGIGTVTDGAGPITGSAAAYVGSTSTNTSSRAFFGTFDGVVDDLTIECFFKQRASDGSTAKTGYGLNIGRAGTSGANTGPCGLYFDVGANTLRLIIMRADGTTTATLVTLTRPTDDVWHHVALVKEGDTFSLYLDGTREVNITDSDYVPFTAESTVCAFWGRSATNACAASDIAMYRVTAGVRYTGSSITVPTALYPTKQLGRVVDWADIFNFL